MIRLAVLLATISYSDIEKLPKPPADHRIAYGPDPLQFGDLRLPKGRGPHPVTILIHGGCWLAAYNVDHTNAMAAALADAGVAVWSAFALAAYVVGLSYLARKESTQGLLSYWPCVLLAVPILLAVILNAEEYQNRALVLATLLGVWVVRSLRYTVWTTERNIGRTVSGLLAGIVLVDLLAVVPASYPMGLIFLLLFASALLFQRFVPAT